MAQNGDKVTFWRGSIKVFNKLREDGRLTADRLYFVGNSQTDSEGLRDSTYGTIYLATSANWCVRFGIFSENSDLDKIANEIYTAIEKEGAERVKADSGLQEKITAEATAREQADDALSQNLSDEATARQTADTAIRDLLASDYATKTELQTAKTTLQNDIDAEATARQEADASLQTSIETETTARKNADDLKADKATTYTKSETNNLLDEKADASTTYSKDETDDLLSAKADASSVYTKTQMDTKLNAKADSDDVYTKTETDSKLNGKADSSSVYSKTETDTKLSAKADSSSVYTKTETNNLLSSKADSSALANYYTKSETYTKDEVDSLVEAKVAFQVVDTLPTTGETAIIYLVPLADPETQNIYDEYMWIGGAWEHIGSTKTDLSDYYTKEETDTKLDTRANVSSVYTKTETDSKLSSKADSSSVYTKTETDTKLNAKANQSTTYTKTEVDTKLGNKANSADVYTQSQIDTKLNSKADKTALSSYYTKTESDSLLSAKQGTITGGATTITTNDLTASRVLVSDSDGKVSVSHITSAELGYMQGVTSNLQKQISSKAENSDVSAKIGTLTNKLNDETTARETAISNVKTELQADIDTKADKSTALDSFQGGKTFPLLLKDGTDSPRWLFGDFVDDTTDPIGSLSVTHYPNTNGTTRLNIGGVQCGEIYLKGYENNGWTSIKPSRGDIRLTLPSKDGTLLTEAALDDYLKKTVAQDTYVSASTYNSDKATTDGRLTSIETFDTKATTSIDNLYTQVGKKEDALSEISTADIDSLISTVCV